jgi:hypothetical protein
VVVDPYRFDSKAKTTEEFEGNFHSINLVTKVPLTCSTRTRNSVANSALKTALNRNIILMCTGLSSLLETCEHVNEFHKMQGRFWLNE